MKPKTILIIDDDVHIGNMLEESLVRAGYAVARAYSGTEALYALSDAKPDLVLLDLMLPGLNGEEVLPHMKGAPVIVVSAKADIDNKVDLLLGGAADYVTKPFHTKELLARIAVQLRQAAATGAPPTLTFGDLTLNTDLREAAIGEKRTKLTRTECAILKALLQNPEQVVAKSVLLDRISADTPDCTESSLKTHVSHLRKKLRDLSGEETIEAVWGIGFRLKISTESQRFS